MGVSDTFHGQMLLGLATNTPLPSGITNRPQVVRPPEDEQEQDGDDGEHDGQEEAQCRHLSLHLLVRRGQRRHLLSAKQSQT